MRLAFAVALALLLAPVAGAGPLRVGIELARPPHDPFVVRVSGHYADFHNGHSRHWKDALVPAGGRHWIPLGPVNPLINMGVSLTAFHPEYLVERQRSRKTPLLVRPVRFDFHPRSWRDVMAPGAEAAAQQAGSRSQLPLWQALGHVQLFLDAWLPAMDARAGASVGAAARRDYLALFDDLVRFVRETGATPLQLTRLPEDPEKRASYLRSLERQELEARVELAELVRRAHAWLSLSSAERVAVRAYMQEMRTPRGLGERLLSDADLDRLGAFLERYAADAAARRDPEKQTSWTDPDTRIRYRVRVLDPPPGCAYLSITTDLTGVVPEDLGDMTHQVTASFCRRASGAWRYGRS